MISLVASILTAALTALFGVVVFAAGQWVQRFLIEPIQDQRKTIGEIAFNLTYLANMANVALVSEHQLPVNYVMPPEQASALLRRLAGQLRASLNTIPWYGLFARLGWLPSRASIIQASTGMIGWSNSLYQGDTIAPRKAVAEALQLDGMPL